MRVLLVEDDSSVAKSIELMLQAEGFIVDITDLGEDGLEIGKIYDYDIIILDLMLPDIDGYEVLRRLRSARVSTPILILSGLSELDNKIKGLGFGADDYLTKPFDLLELQARLRALIRRAGGTSTPILEHAGVMLDPASKRVTRDGQPVPLSAREYALLHDLLSHKQHIRSRSQLEESLYAWGEETGSNTVEVYIHQLRKKLGADFIRTVRGLGYRLDDTS